MLASSPDIISPIPNSSKSESACYHIISHIHLLIMKDSYSYKNNWNKWYVLLTILAGPSGFFPEFARHCYILVCTRHSCRYNIEILQGITESSSQWKPGGWADRNNKSWRWNKHQVNFNNLVTTKMYFEAFLAPVWYNNKNHLKYF